MNTFATPSPVLECAEKVAVSPGEGVLGHLDAWTRGGYIYAMHACAIENDLTGGSPGMPRGHPAGRVTNANSSR